MLEIFGGGPGSSFFIVRSFPRSNLRHSLKSAQLARMYYDTSETSMITLFLQVGSFVRMHVSLLIVRKSQHCSQIWIRLLKPDMYIVKLMGV